MKKLLVLALVLSVATMANAALQLTITGPSELATGATGTYTVGYGGDAILGSDVDVTGTLGTIGGGLAITSNRDAALDYFGINVASPNYECAIINDIAGTDMGSPLFSFQFTAPAFLPPGGVAHIQLLDNAQLDLNWNQVMDAVMPSFRVFAPEPMTLGLLGLGGLFLRRRK